MTWLIVIVAVILVVVFWRIFLPLALVIGAVGAVAFLVIHLNEKSKERERQQAEMALSQKIAKAREAATPEGKRWIVGYEKDPSNGRMIVRSAAVQSNDTLCNLVVEKRIDGTALTGLYCPDFKIPSYAQIEVKFSEATSSQSMDLRQFNNGDSVYIPSYQYSGRLAYETFMRGLQTNKAVAIKLPTTSAVWMTFTLEGARAAIDGLGKEKGAAE